MAGFLQAGMIEYSKSGPGSSLSFKQGRAGLETCIQSKNPDLNVWVWEEGHALCSGDTLVMVLYMKTLWTVTLVSFPGTVKNIGM